MRVPEATARFVVRAPSPEDAGLYGSLYTDPDTMRHVAPPWSSAQASANFARVLSACVEPEFRYRLWVVATHASEPVGVIALTGNTALAELGMMILPGWRSLGVAKEVVPSVTRYAFDALGVARVAARHVLANGAGAQVMQALGFTPEPDAEAGWQTWCRDREA